MRGEDGGDAVYATPTSGSPTSDSGLGSLGRLSRKHNRSTGARVVCPSGPQLWQDVADMMFRHRLSDVGPAGGVVRHVEHLPGPAEARFQPDQIFICPENNG